MANTEHHRRRPSLSGEAGLGVDLETLAEQLGITHQAVRAIEVRAIRKIIKLIALGVLPPHVYPRPGLLDRQP